VNIKATSTGRILSTLFALLLLTGVAVANICGDEDRVQLQEGVELETPALTLSTDAVDELMRAIYSVRRGTFKPCTGIAISPHWILLAQHCFEKDEAVAKQVHLASPPPPFDVRKLLRADQEMLDWLKDTYRALPAFANNPDKLAAQLANLEQIENHPRKLLSILIDFAVFERVEGEFAYFVSPDFSFDFSAISGTDVFAVVGLPIFGDGVIPSVGQKKLWFSPVTSLAYDDPETFGNRGLAEMKLAKRKRKYPKVWDRQNQDDRPPEPNHESLVSFCSDIFQGNSGSPLIRFYEVNGELAMSVVAVTSSGLPKPVAAEFPNVAAMPLSFIWVRDYVKERTEGYFQAGP